MNYHAELFSTITWRPPMERSPWMLFDPRSLQTYVFETSSDRSTAKRSATRAMLLVHRDDHYKGMPQVKVCMACSMAMSAKYRSKSTFLVKTNVVILRIRFLNPPKINKLIFWLLMQLKYHKRTDRQVNISDEKKNTFFKMREWWPVVYVLILPFSIYGLRLVTFKTFFLFKWKCSKVLIFISS